MSDAPRPCLDPPPPPSRTCPCWRPINGPVRCESATGRPHSPITGQARVVWNLACCWSDYSLPPSHHRLRSELGFGITLLFTPPAAPNSHKPPAKPNPHLRGTPTWVHSAEPHHLGAEQGRKASTTLPSSDPLLVSHTSFISHLARAAQGPWPADAGANLGVRPQCGASPGFAPSNSVCIISYVSCWPFTAAEDPE